MESFIQKIINAGFGAASLAMKRTAEIVNDLMEEGKISEEEGKRILNDLSKEGEEQRGEFEKEMKSLMEKILNKMNIPSRKDYEALEKRIELLEQTQTGASPVV